jgi:5-methylcytosine-specific restriction endonuclease McrA
MRRDFHNNLIKKVEEISPNKYTILDHYNGFKTKIRVQCNTCGHIFISNARNLYRGLGCFPCSVKRKTFSHELFLSKVKDIHNSRIKVLDVYINARFPINFQCNTCLTIWKTKPEHILAGHACPHCCRAKEKSGTWQGGKTSESLTIRHSKKYKDWRSEIFIRDNYTCIVCGKRGKKLAAHHIDCFSKYPQKRFDLDNGITLCEKDHSKYHMDYGYTNDLVQFNSWLKQQTTSVIPFRV